MDPVEPGETLPDTQVREVRQVREETGWRLRQVRRLLGITTWTGDDGDGMRHEVDYLVDVDVDGDLPTPLRNGPSTRRATGSAPKTCPGSRRTADRENSSSTTWSLRRCKSARQEGARLSVAVVAGHGGRLARDRAAVGRRGGLRPGAPVT
ncbi:NUDIX domain-containing protein [Streptomyces sp. NPDC051135]|uniref:NUDIX domain-containing protein n=1 Tax=unclassified Streptomyces TaxID=2593676 RepID=UPI003443801C